TVLQRQARSTSAVTLERWLSVLDEVPLRIQVQAGSKTARAVPHGERWLCGGCCHRPANDHRPQLKDRPLKETSKQFSPDRFRNGMKKFLMKVALKLEKEINDIVGTVHSWLA